MELFSTKGYHATSMRDLAEYLGIQAGSLYSHINSKEDVLFEIMVHGAQGFLQGAEPIPDLPVSASEKLRLFLEMHIRTVAEHMAASTVFLHEWKRIDPERRAQVQETRDRYADVARRIIRQGVLDGEFRHLDERFAVLLVLSVANWTYQWYDPDGALGPGEVAAIFSDMILAGFQPAAGAEGAEPNLAPPAD